MTATITEIETVTIEHLDEARPCDHSLDNWVPCPNEAKWTIKWRNACTGTPPFVWTLACNDCHDKVLTPGQTIVCGDCGGWYYAKDLVVEMIRL